VLCYKCVDACGDQHQNTFAITVAGRGFDAHVSTEYANPLPESACVYCGNCIAVCPTGALMPVSEYELRQANEWDESRQTETETICAFCGVGCSLTLHVQDERIVKVTSPADHDVTLGNLCIKGRFGFEHVQPRDRQGQGRPAPSEAAGRDPLGGNGAPPEPAAPEAEIDPSPPEASAATPGRDAPGSATSDQQ
jgi:predicted molibdopterin-dependent oxidoreductase YjgC